MMITGKSLGAGNGTRFNFWRTRRWRCMVRNPVERCYLSYAFVPFLTFYLIYSLVLWPVEAVCLPGVSRKWISNHGMSMT